MNYIGIIKALLIVGGTGCIIGILLGIASKVFAVKIDERVEKIREMLPGNNCGACGFPGCDGLAEAIANESAPADGCPVGGPETASNIADFMGVTVSPIKKVAFVKCSGDCDKAGNKYDYSGNMDCNEANNVSGGPKSCTYGCMGMGSCVSVCEFDAIHILNGIAVVDKEKCVSCGKCIQACPKKLIEIIPYLNHQKVACNSNDKGMDVKKVCTTGCIGCGLCARNCPSEAITIDNFLAHIDYDKCTGCGICTEKCPVKVITNV